MRNAWHSHHFTLNIGSMEYTLSLLSKIFCTNHGCLMRHSSVSFHSSMKFLCLFRFLLYRWSISNSRGSWFSSTFGNMKAFYYSELRQRWLTFSLFSVVSLGPQFPADFHNHLEPTTPSLSLLSNHDYLSVRLYFKHYLLLCSLSSLFTLKFYSSSQVCFLGW